MRRTALVLALALACALAPVAAGAAGAADLPHTRAEAELVFRDANEAFLAKDYEKALEGYRRVVEAGYGTAEVQYNLGNAALEGGHLGEAVLAYQRALRLDPLFEDAKANLAVARARNVDKLVGASDGPPFLERVARALPPAPVTWAFLGAWLLLFGALLLRRFAPRARLALTLAAAVGLLGSVGLGSLLGVTAWYRERMPEGVVLEKVVEVRKGPAPRFESGFEVHEGLTVRLLDTDGPYVRVRLANGLEGWVLRTAVRRI